MASLTRCNPSDLLVTVTSLLFVSNFQISREYFCSSRQDPPSVWRCINSCSGMVEHVSTAEHLLRVQEETTNVFQWRQCLSKMGAVLAFTLRLPIFKHVCSHMCRAQGHMYVCVTHSGFILGKTHFL